MKFKYIPIIVPLLFSIFYAIGYLVWFSYLTRLGFYSVNLVEARYVITGILFVFSVVLKYWVIILVIFFTICIFLYFEDFFRSTTIWKTYINIRNKMFRSNLIKFFYKIFFIILFLVVIFFYTQVFISKEFLIFTPSFGGGRPQVVSLIVDTELLDTLTEIKIETRQKSFSKTQNLCLVYEDENKVVIATDENPEFKEGFIGRLLQIDKKYIIGGQSTPRKEIEEHKNRCSKIMETYMYQKFTLLLKV